MSYHEELDDWKDIENSGGTIGTGINRAIHKLVLTIFNSGQKTSAQVMHLGSQIAQLNENLVAASESSKRLTNSIKNATWAAAIIGGLGVIVAFFNLINDFF